MKFFKNKWSILILLSITWGSSFILIKKSLEVFSPYQVGAIRVIVSGIIFMWIGFPALKKMDHKTLSWLIVAGALGNFVPMFLFPMAQTKVSSSLAGILDSLVPVFVLIIGFIFFKIRSKTIQWMGTVVGFIGAASLMYFSDTAAGGSDMGYAMLVVLATACYAGAALIINKKLSHVPSLQLSSGIFTVWIFPSVIILLFSGIFREFNTITTHWSGVGYLAVLSVIGTALAMLLYFRLIQITSAVFASMVTYLIPVVAVFWGLLAGESFSVWYALGGVLILAGIYMVQEKHSKESEKID